MISILLPTRNRPGNLSRLYESICQTTTQLNNIELCVYIDSDDTVSLPIIQYISTKINTKAISGEYQRGVRTPQWMLYNSLYEQASNDIIMYCADDVVFRTEGWDSIVTSTFNTLKDKIALVYGPDGFQGGTVPVCTHGFIHKNWVEIVGHFFVKHFNVAYNDTWFTEVAESIKRRFYIQNLYIEHIHPAAGKSNWDETYTSKTESAGGESNIWKYTKPERELDIEKLKKYIQSFE